MMESKSKAPEFSGFGFGLGGVDQTNFLDAGD